MEPLKYDWKITARKGAAWAGATFLAGILGALEAGEFRWKTLLYSGAVAVILGAIQALRNYQKVSKQVAAGVVIDPAA